MKVLSHEDEALEGDLRPRDRGNQARILPAFAATVVEPLRKKKGLQFDSRPPRTFVVRHDELDLYLVNKPAQDATLSELARDMGNLSFGAFVALI